MYFQALNVPNQEKNAPLEMALLVKYLKNAITGFVTTPSERVRAATLDLEDQGEHFKTKLVHEVTALFVRKNPSTLKGEVGELLMSILAERRLGLNKVFSKLRLKTSTEMPVHGSDGVFVSNEDGELWAWMGESKAYSKVDRGVAAAVLSSKGLLENIDHEFLLLRDNAELDTPEMTEFVRKYFDDSSGEHNALNIGALIMTTYSDLESYENEDATKISASSELLQQTHDRHIVSKQMPVDKIKTIFLRVPDISVLAEKFRESITGA